MMTQRFCLLVGAIALGLAGCAKPAPRAPHKEVLTARAFHYEHDIQLFEVTNGMFVAMAPEKNTNLVKVDVRYKVGAAEDPPGKAGLAHLVEHMLFLVRSSEDAPTIWERLRSAALSYNAYTIWDETHYTQTAPSDRLAELLEIERDRMAVQCERFDEENFARERQVVVQELLGQSEQSRSDHGEIRTAIFGPDHAYTRSVGGSPDDVAKLTLADVCAFIDEHYAPARAVLSISGNFDMAATQKQVGSLFGPIKKQAKSARRPVEAFRVGVAPTKIKLDIEEATVLIAFREPIWGRDEWVAWDFARAFLDSHARRLVAKHDYITDSEVVHVGGFRGGATVFALSVDDPKRLLSAGRAFFDKMAESTRGWDETGLVEKKARRMGQLVRSLEPFQRRAERLADYLQYTDNTWLMLGHMRALEQLETKELRSYAEKRFARTASRIIYVLPKEDGPAEHKRVVMSSTSREYDIESTLAPVDEAEADKPLVAIARPKLRARTDFTLDNGLRVVLVPSFGHPTFDARMVFPAGFAHDPTKRPGLAHLAAHLLQYDFGHKWKGSEFFRVRRVMLMGGVPSVTVSERSTTFRMRGLSMFADGLLWELHWLLESGKYSGKLVKALRKQVREAEPDDDDERSARKVRVLLEGLYGKGHPYAAIAHAEAIARVGKGDLQRFRRAHYRANGATLIITGQFNSHALREQIERLFGTWKRGKPPRPVPSIPAAKPAPGAKHIALADDEGARPSVLIAFPTTPGFRGMDAPRRVLVQMLRQRMAALRERLGATYGAEVQHHTREGPGALMITADLDAAVAGKALRLMREAIIDLRNGKNLREDFVRARRKSLERALAASVDSGSVGNEIAFTVTHELPNEYFDQIADAIANMTLQRIQALVKIELAGERQIILVSGPEKLVDEIYEQAGIERFRRLK